ncbi:dGTPase [Erwinia sp. OLTSP20]|uniref:dGTPase n=1 Tax=unclassified Erwinia TaxID=2622719 RepID=UPI000C182D7D|nr:MULTISPECIES: dGTPase [unclassified Erwinia]PIJ49809.1 dGTPase [Erwinia sp. OAMSP11]PIJ70908.1 dGTPase [Erwinia sp. OLSSP12]PIJ80274.1 dGTPase [Erwinia sp. OLCASP19]PIJ82398.1 dGTPase [Erwinia sp. OLMTSP26]PIJ85083.1 dGTPase [Erwinia sp. OLMDSP33]
MSVIDFRKKISYQRRYRAAQGNKDEHEILRIFESDRGRIINSAAIRRLQQKTQVFPLERNAAVRSRLTHSLEVQQVGRYIAKEILTRLKEQHGLAKYGLETLTGPFESVVEMACLMHDIGNPPFGHFGESAINDWFRQHLAPDWSVGVAAGDPCLVGILRYCDDGLNDLRAKIRQDLSFFEGNAQAIRLVHTLMKMNLTWAQVGCILKYTRPAWHRGELPAGYNYLMKKPGYYLAEEAYVSNLRKALNLQDYNRFPLTYIMEAADDISYCVADLEDAVEKNIFTVEKLHQYLYQLWPQHKKGDLFDLVVNNALDKSKANRLSRSSEDQFFMYLRVNTVACLVPQAAGCFITHLEAIYQGNFNQALLEDESPHSQLLEIFKKVAIRHVFNHPDVEQLELQGYRVIKGLLDIYSPLLALSHEEFSELVEKDTLKHYPIETRLFHKLSTRFRLAYSEAVANISPLADDFPLWEYYYRARLIQDYISGMTDLYAWDEYRRMMAVE